MDKTDKWLGRDVIKLQESEATYRQLFESSDEAIQICELVFDDEGHPVDNIILDVNPAYEQQTGLKRDEVIGRHIKDILPVVEQIWLERYAEVVHECKSMHFEEYNAGVNRWFDVHATSLKDNRFAAVFTDITEHKKADEKLRESERQYSELFNSMNEMFQVLELIYDDNDKVVDYYYRDMNPAFEQLTGKTREQLIDKNVKSIFGIVEDYWLEAYDKALKTGKPVDFMNYGAELDKYYDVHIWKIKENQVAVIFNDITEHKKAEEELKRSEETARQRAEELEILMDMVPAAIFVSEDPHCLSIVGNKEANRMYEVERGIDVSAGTTEGEVLNLERRFFKNGKELKPEELPMQASIKKGVNVLNYEMDALLPSSRMITMFGNANPLFDDKGKVRGCIGVYVDITDLKKAEEAISQSKKLLQDIIDGFPSPIFVKDTEGRFLTINKNLEELLGVKNEELIGKSDYDIITKELADYNRANDQKVIEEGKAIPIEEEADLIDGHHTFIANKFPIYDNNGKPYGIGSISTDITERKLLEEKLKAAHANLEQKVEDRTAELKLASIYNRSLIEASLDPLVTIGSDGKITDVNHSTENVTGYNRNELIGTDFSDYFTEPEKARKGYQKVFKKGIVLNYPLEIKNKNGHITPVLYNASIYKDEFGEVLGVFAAARDITQMKQTEDKLKEYQYTLEDKVQKRTEELSKSIIELKRSNEELERFAYVSSHDLQEPLRMVTLYSQLLERRYKDSLDSDADDFIEYIVENAKRMKQLIDDLLEYSRVTNKAKEFENVDLEKILDLVLTNLSVSIAENNVKVNHEPLPTVFGDENQMLQIFQNLITNAIKFRGRESPEINITAKKGQTEWIFSVSDNGIGINPEHQKQIFEVFKRLHTKEEYPGTGIGLSIVQKIIKHHGGQIWVESESGKGSTFYFTIPSNFS